MSESKHSPGPWRQNIVNELTVVDSTGAEICEISAPYEDGDDYDVHVADARLITAAPEMLAALKYARNYVVMGYPVQIIDDAIAKADEATHE